MKGYNKGNIHVAFKAFCPATKKAFKSDSSFLCFDPVIDYENPYRVISLMYLPQ